MIRGVLRAVFVVAVLVLVEVGEPVISVLRESRLSAGEAAGFWGLFVGLVVVAYLVGVALWRSTDSRRRPETSPRPGAGGLPAGARVFAAVVASDRGVGAALPRLHP